jgi:hypothetical protein
VEGGGKSCFEMAIDTGSNRGPTIGYGNVSVAEWKSLPLSVTCHSLLVPPDSHPMIPKVIFIVIDDLGVMSRLLLTIVVNAKSQDHLYLLTRTSAFDFSKSDTLPQD